MRPLAHLVTLSSPRRWGCFSIYPQTTPMSFVFPTQVGVFPGWISKGSVKISLPHAGGGVSKLLDRRTFINKSSPRRWGCFSQAIEAGRKAGVFPTQVGVFLIPAGWCSFSACLPHAGGGVSHRDGSGRFQPLSSPRRWGCF